MSTTTGSTRFAVANQKGGVGPTMISINFGGAFNELGLDREIVEAHDWEIRVTDGANGGTQFEITGVDMPRIGNDL